MALNLTVLGRVNTPPETQGPIPKLQVKTYPSKIVADMLWINVFDEDIDSGYAMSFAQKIYDDYKGQYSIIKDTWHNNVRHCIENQLDYTHLATVHKKTIGRGYKIPKNIELNLEDDYIDVYKDGKLMLKYIHANSWLLNNTDSMNIYVYFAPINEHETKIYVLNYRNFLNAKNYKANHRYGF